ncbi:hypothetical protein LCGC14_2048320 [marine sediment metagenome]|uniref:Uncharacterized protein n=1 Tax=marine sediment metagenome TaxID=412755 RepID=A0A0F9EPQ3_9ZZZZ
MPQEGNLQVVSFARSIDADDFGAVPVEMGARGEAVELWGLHLIPGEMGVVVSQSLMVALSSNPSHELTPPGSEDAFLADRALYGMAMARKTSHTAIGEIIVPQDFVPLYGIVRPRRQILVWSFIRPAATLVFRVEIYYRPVSLNKHDLDALNLKYGKYRRGA